MADEREILAELLAIVREHGLESLRVRFGEATYELVAREPHAFAPPPAPAAAAVPPSVEEAPSGPPANVSVVGAPIVGVFYRASAPGAEPFVDVGDRVEVGAVLCILEAMKLMNEITSEYAGIVRKIVPENGALVALGEELVWIER
ncbi:MAG: acetyl-CoA carboxylase biotin carboxyl carrier protein [Vulcanimicrobiaceae bacterium]